MPHSIACRLRITEELKKTPAGAIRVARMTERTDRFLTEAVEKGDQAAAQGGIDVDMPKNEPPPQAFIPFGRAAAPAVVPVADAPADPVAPRPRPPDNDEELAHDEPPEGNTHAPLQGAGSDDVIDLTGVDRASQDVILAVMKTQGWRGKVKTGPAGAPGGRPRPATPPRTGAPPAVRPLRCGNCGGEHATRDCTKPLQLRCRWSRRTRLPRARSAQTGRQLCCQATQWQRPSEGSAFARRRRERCCSHVDDRQRRL